MTDQSKMGKERRKYTRYPGLLVEYSLYSKDNEESFQKSALTKDISLGGICIYIKEPLEIGSLMNLRIYFFEMKEPVEVKAEVMWQSKAGELGNHAIGLEFKEIDEANRSMLIKQIAALEKQGPSSADNEKKSQDTK